MIIRLTVVCFLSVALLRSRIPPGLAGAARRPRCRAALFRVTQWLPAWPLTPTLPAVCLTSWVCPVPEVTWDRATWAVCLEVQAWAPASTATIWTWTLTGSRPASPLCAWKPRNTVQPSPGPHDHLNARCGCSRCSLTTQWEKRDGEEDKNKQTNKRGWIQELPPCHVWQRTTTVREWTDSENIKLISTTSLWRKTSWRRNWSDNQRNENYPKMAHLKELRRIYS